MCNYVFFSMHKHKLKLFMFDLCTSQICGPDLQKLESWNKAQGYNSLKGLSENRLENIIM